VSEVDSKYKYQVHWKNEKIPCLCYRGKLDLALSAIYRKAMGNRTDIELWVMDGEKAVQKFKFNKMTWKFNFISGSGGGPLGRITNLERPYQELVAKLEAEKGDAAPKGETYRVTCNDCKRNNGVTMILANALDDIYIFSQSNESDIKLSILVDGVVDRVYRFYPDKDSICSWYFGYESGNKQEGVYHGEYFSDMYAEIVKEKSEAPKPQIFVTTNPGPEGHKWVEEFFINNQTNNNEEHNMSITLKNNTQAEINQNIGNINSDVNELQEMMKHCHELNATFDVSLKLRINYDEEWVNDNGEKGISHKVAHLDSQQIADIPEGDFKAFANNLLGRYKAHMSAAKQAQKDLTVIKVDKF